MNAMLKESLDLDTARIRALQAMYPEAHLSLRNWGIWSADRRGIFPTLTKPGLWDQFKRSELDEYGEVKDDKETNVVPIRQEVKSEAAERLPYDERTGCALDERIHSAGGLPLEVRIALRVAYVSRETPENQFPRFSGCGIDAFCERLEMALRFAARFR